MEIKDVSDVRVKRARPQRFDLGIFEKFLLNEDILVKLLCMKKGLTAIVDKKEIGSVGDTIHGTAIGLDKVFVAAKMPLKATTKGADTVIIRHTGTFNEGLYATKETIKSRESHTAYDQPSVGMMARVRGWLDEHPEIKKLIENPEMCRTIAEREPEEVTIVKVKEALKAAEPAQGAKEASSAG